MDRTVLVAGLEASSSWAEELFLRTNSLLRMHTAFSPKTWMVFQLGSRVRNGLRALTLIHDHRCDDQIPFISRGFLLRLRLFDSEVGLGSRIV